MKKPPTGKVGGFYFLEDNLVCLVYLVYCPEGKAKGLRLKVHLHRF